MNSKSRTYRIASTVVATLAAVLATAGGASAETYCVGKPACTGIVKVDPQSALTAASITPGPDRIEIGPGTFFANDGFVYVGAGATNKVEIVGAGRDETELQGGSNVNKRPAVWLQGSAPSAISDLTIKSLGAPDPKFRTEGLRIFGAAERIGVKAGAQATGVELLKGSTLKSSRVSLPGGFYGVLSADGEATVIDCSIDASNDGTAAVASESGTLNVSHSKLNGVTGAVAWQDGTLKIDNSLVLASDMGLSGIASQGKSSTLVATGVTVVGSDPSVVGIYSGTPAGGTTHVTIDSSAIHVSSSLQRDSINGGDASLTIHHSAYDHASISEFGPGSIDQSQSNLDLKSLGFVDSTADDYRLAADSPLRDVGNPNPAGGLAATDLGGNTRSVDGNGDGIAAPDIGAYEFQPPPSPTSTPPAPTGSTTPAPAATPSGVALAITSASLTNRRFSIGRARTAVAARARKRGTIFRATLSKDASLRIGIRRTGARRKAGTLKRAAHEGLNRIAFSGRIGRRALRPGRYVATLTATDASGKRSAPRTLRFTVLKG